MDYNSDNNIDYLKQKNEAELIDSEVFDEGLPRSFETYSHSTKYKSKARFFNYIRLHGKTILNIVLSICLFGIAVGWLIGSVGVTLSCLVLIALGIVINYTVINTSPR